MSHHLVIGDCAEFHRHLDDCAQCRDNPFALCEIGERFLKLVAEGKRPTVNIFNDFFK